VTGLDRKIAFRVCTMARILVGAAAALLRHSAGGDYMRASKAITDLLEGERRNLGGLHGTKPVSRSPRCTFGLLDWLAIGQEPRPISPGGETAWVSVLIPPLRLSCLWATRRRPRAFAKVVDVRPVLRTNAPHGWIIGYTVTPGVAHCGLGVTFMSAVCASQGRAIMAA